MGKQNSRRQIDPRRVWATTTNDLRQLWQSPDYWGPMLLLGSIFFIILPILSIAAINSVGEIPAISQFSSSASFLPGNAGALVSGVPESARAAYVVAVYLIAPVAVVIPLTVSVSIGSNSIVGEKEKGTGEFLAHSAMRMEEVYLGKLLAAFIPGYLTTLVGFACYAVIVNLMLADSVGRIFFPTTAWLILIFWVLPAFLITSLSVVLRISSRVKSGAAAQQASSLTTFPLILITYAQVNESLIGSSSGLASFWLGSVIWVVALALVYRGATRLPRSRLLGVANEG